MKIFLCGEGKTEYGYEEFDRRTGSFKHVEGALELLIKKMFKECLSIKDLRMETFRMAGLPREPGQPKIPLRGFARHGYVAIRETARRGLDGLIIVGDDKIPDRFVGQIKTGILKAIEKNSVLERLPWAAGAPKPMLESWLLADTTAFNAAFNKHENIEKSFPDIARPENLSSHRQSEKHPKNILDKIFKRLNQRGGLESKSRIVQHMSLSTVKKKCNESFVPFASLIKKSFG